VEGLLRPEGRSLRPFEPPAQGVADRVLSATGLLDAEYTPNRWSRIRRSFLDRPWR
jgi:phospholipase D1/2